MKKNIIFQKPFSVKLNSIKPKVPFTLKPWIVFVISFLLYAIIGWLATFVLQMHNLDGLSRIAQALSVFYSREPKMANIGFVWMPLPVISEIPLVLLFRPLGLVLYAGPIMSAFFAAFAIVQLNEILQFFEIPTGWRIIWMILFGIHPLILHNATMGLSEAPFLAFLFGTISNFLYWQRDHQTNRIMRMAFFAVFALFCRYEALVLVMVICIAIMWDWWRSAKPNSANFLEANLIIFLVPSLYGMMFWMFINWLIMGNPINFLVGQGSTATTPDTAQYIGSSHPYFFAMRSIIGSVQLILQQSINLAPLLLIASIVLIMVIIIKRKINSFIYIILGWSVLGFTFYTAYRGLLPAFTRYFFWVVPGGVIVAAALYQTIQNIRFRTMVAIGISAIMLFPVYNLSVKALSQEPQPFLEKVIAALITPPEIKNLKGVQEQLDEFKSIAQFLDEQPSNTLTMIDFDVANSLFFYSKHPQNLISASDQDFLTILRSPIGQVQQILIPEPNIVSIGHSIILRTYPKLYFEKEKWATLKYEFPGPSHWRLFQIASP